MGFQLGLGNFLDPKLLRAAAAFKWQNGGSLYRALLCLRFIDRVSAPVYFSSHVSHFVVLRVTLIIMVLRKIKKIISAQLISNGFQVCTIGRPCKKYLSTLNVTLIISCSKMHHKDLNTTLLFHVGSLC